MSPKFDPTDESLTPEIWARLRNQQQARRRLFPEFRIVPSENGVLIQHFAHASDPRPVRYDFQTLEDALGHLGNHLGEFLESGPGPLPRTGFSPTLPLEGLPRDPGTPLIRPPLAPYAPPNRGDH